MWTAIIYLTIGFLVGRYSSQIGNALKSGWNWVKAQYNRFAK